MPFDLVAVGLVGVAAAVTLPDLVLLDQATPFAQLVSFRPYVLTGVAALVLVLAGLSWRCRRLVPATSMLMIVLSVGTALVIPRTQAEPLPAGGRALTVLTFNTLNGSADVDEVAALIGRERPDLVALIEAGNAYRDRLAPLVEPHGYRTFTAAGMDGDGDVEDLHGVTTLVADHLGPVTSDADMSAPFPSMRVEGGELGAVRFVAYHAVAPRVGDVDQWRSDLDKLSRYCAGNTPAIIAGDFNATLDHSALRAAIAGCSDAASQRGQGLVPTWPTWAPDWSARRSTTSSPPTRSRPSSSPRARSPAAITALCSPDYEFPKEQRSRPERSTRRDLRSIAAGEKYTSVGVATLVCFSGRS